MNDHDIEAMASEVSEGLSCFASFTGIGRGHSRDVFFIVMGMTGSGKSTFVSDFTGTDSGIGHGLRSFTDSIKAYRHDRIGWRVHLVDTPGFNDTNRSNAETLEILATYLGASYANGVPIHGIILLHPITDNRVGHTSLLQIDMVRSMCGLPDYSNLAILTTMWPEKSPTDSEERQRLEAREHELRTDDRFFGAFIKKGATMFRHHDSGQSLPDRQESAARIVEWLISSSKRRPMKAMKLQLEMIDEKKKLAETEAVQAILGKEIRKQRQASLGQLTDIRHELERLTESSKSKHADDLRRLRESAEARLRQLNRDHEILGQTMQDLHQKETLNWYRRMEMVEQELRAKVEASERELQDLEESLRLTREGLVRHSSGVVTVTHTVAPSSSIKIVVDARRKSKRARDAYRRVFDEETRKPRIMEELANGAAAGAVSGVIALVSGALCSLM